jgi:hypothetical protein
VGILRAGKLVRVADLAELRKSGETSLEQIFLSYYSESEPGRKALPQ